MMTFQIGLLFLDLTTLLLYLLATFLVCLFVLRDHRTHRLTHIILNAGVVRHSINTAAVLAIIGLYGSRASAS
ncbi:Uncharacterised protein [Raoultella planticola]|uniref:Uncharacterized protein n=1 Tax=Raoultella planticola TaxID=575 RepID=A0A485D2Q3_RAOPL|nr:Uncharacterised protein [Raoultella planticola]